MSYKKYLELVCEGDIISVRAKMQAKQRGLVHQSHNIWKDKGDVEYKWDDQGKHFIQIKKDDLNKDKELDLKDISKEQINELEINIKKNLNKFYEKIDILNRFTSDGFNINVENSNMLVDIPYMSINKSKTLSEKIINGSKEIILKHLKKMGINKKKSNFKYVSSGKGFFSAITYSL